MLGCNCAKSIKQTNQKTKNILLIGCPNVGKSTYFNIVTWSNSTVANVDKITISANKGKMKSANHITLLDLPGTYTCSPNTKEEEIITDYLVNTDYSKIVNICSIHSLERDFYLTIELCETQKLKHLLINMIDESDEKSINVLKLTNRLGLDVDLISCYKRTNIKNSINNIINNDIHKPFSLNYGYQVEHTISKIIEAIQFETKVDKRFLAIQFLLKNNYIDELFTQHNIKNDILTFMENNGYITECLTYQINLVRKKFIKNLIHETVDNDRYQRVLLEKKNKQLKIDKILFNKWVAYPLFILIIFLIYFITFYKYAGGFFTELINGGFELAQTKINDRLINLHHTSQWVADFVSDGLLGGIFTVIGFLPNIAIIFVLMSILEQTGLLARISVLLDKQLSKFGLSGRSVITLLTGIGCNIPSILMARNAQSKKEKIIILLIAPLISCGARTVAFNWIGTALVGGNFSWLISLGLTFFSGFVALILGYCFSSTLFRNKKTFLLTEIPFLRKPNFINILKALGVEIWNFLKKVLTVVFIVNIIIFLLSRISFQSGLIENIDTFYENHPNDGSILYYIAYGFKYILYPIGLGYDWKMSMSLISAAPAKEIISSTLEQLYGGQEQFKIAVLNLKTPVSIMTSFFIFSLFYTPCISTTVVLKKEGGWKWMFIQLAVSFGLAYLLSYIFFTYMVGIELLVHNFNGIYIIFLTLMSISFVYMVISQGYGFYLINNTKIVSKSKYDENKIYQWLFSVIFIVFTIATNVYCLIQYGH